MLNGSSVSERFQLTSSRLKEASAHDLKSFTFVVSGEKYKWPCSSVFPFEAGLRLNVS